MLQPLGYNHPQTKTDCWNSVVKVNFLQNTTDIIPSFANDLSRDVFCMLMYEFESLLHVTVVVYAVWWYTGSRYMYLDEFPEQHYFHNNLQMSNCIPTNKKLCMLKQCPFWFVGYRYVSLPLPQRSAVTLHESASNKIGKISLNVQRGRTFVVVQDQDIHTSIAMKSSEMSPMSSAILNDVIWLAKSLIAWCTV